MKTCSTCKFWGKQLDWFEPRDCVDVRFCQHPMVCQHNYGIRQNTIMTQSGVYTMDEGGCTGEFATGPKFGCLHHEG